MKTKSKKRCNCAYVKPPYTKKEFEASAARGVLGPPGTDEGLVPDAILARLRKIGLARNLSEFEPEEEARLRVEIASGELCYIEAVRETEQILRYPDGEERSYEKSKYAHGIFYSISHEQEAKLLCQEMEKGAVIILDVVSFNTVETIRYYNDVIIGRLLGYREDDINAFLKVQGTYQAAMKQHAAANRAGIKAVL